MLLRGLGAAVGAAGSAVFAGIKAEKDMFLVKRFVGLITHGGWLRLAAWENGDDTPGGMRLQGRSHGPRLQQRVV
jgi:hypothetical protein